MFDFDKLKITLVKNNTPEVEKIKNWLIKSITIESTTTNIKGIFTESCFEYLSNIPDDIEMGIEENPGKLKKEFYEHWALTRDMKRIPGVHPFELGDGGCDKIHILSPQYIGSKSNEFYFNTLAYCDNNKKDNNKLILKVIIQKGKFVIDDVLSQTKTDYFQQ